MSANDPTAAVAVVGIAARFPGAPDTETFWRNLCEGRESITTIAREQLESAGVSAQQASEPGYVPRRGVLADGETFDPAFFGFCPRDAEIMDPQIRQFLMCAWEACENAGYRGGEGRKVSVFAGMSISSYLLHLLSSGGEHNESVMRALLLNDRDYLATLTAYKLDCRGSALTVQTACSSSLVAVHLACQSLLTGESDFALAGGVSIAFPQYTGYTYEPEGFRSPDGSCRAFDAAAQGMVEGNGVGVVLLRRLEDALRDRDPIHAVILGSAVNNDGALRVGYSAPGVEGQARALNEALSMADVERDSVRYVETHGSGTALGDSIEIAALTRSYGRERSTPCVLGSVKTNVGHLGAAAGIAGFLKAVLAVSRGVIPGTLHFEKPHPNLDLASGRFLVSSSAQPWPCDDAPRRAGVSSFGIGGTNAHVIVEQPPQIARADQRGREQVVVLSALTERALDEACVRLADHLERTPALPLADVAHTLQIGRRELPLRRSLVATDPREAARALRSGSYVQGEVGSTPAVAFLFSGLGDQYLGMAAELYREEPVFARAYGLCADAFLPLLNVDLRSICAQPASDSKEVPARIDLRALLGRGPAPARPSELARTALAQPAVFALQFALVELLSSYGIQPQYVLGHSLGECAAAYVAGILSFDDAIALVAKRALLIEAAGEGAMLACSLSEQDVAPYLDDTLSLAAINGVDACTLSGTPSAIDALEARLLAAEVPCKRVAARQAFHSSMMDEPARQLAEFTQRLAFTAPKLAYLSNVTGGWLTELPADYWSRHLRSTVRFADGVRSLFARDPSVLVVEVGPGSSLSSFVQHLREADRTRPTVATVRNVYEHTSDRRFFLESLGELWTSGVAVDWRPSRELDCHRLALPTYPFERDHYAVGASLTLQAGGVGLVPSQHGAAPVQAAGGPRGVRRRPYVAPRNQIEESIVGIWSDLLGVSPIGVDDEFVALGGHSLLGLRVLARVRSQFGVELTLRELFESRSPAALALSVEELMLLEIERSEREDSFELTSSLADVAAPADVLHAGTASGGGA